MLAEALRGEPDWRGILRIEKGRVLVGDGELRGPSVPPRHCGLGGRGVAVDATLATCARRIVREGSTALAAGDAEGPPKILG
jgi:hypothetical protein